jgi:hypothetical protein
MDNQETEIVVGIATELDDWRGGVRYVPLFADRHAVCPHWRRALTKEDQDQIATALSNRSCIPWIIVGELKQS